MSEERSFYGDLQERIADLEAELDVWKSNASLSVETINELTADDTRLREALENAGDVLHQLGQKWKAAAIRTILHETKADQALAATAGDGSEEGA